MAKRRLAEESDHDSRDKKRVRIPPAVNDFCFSGNDDDFEQEECDSSVGSNHPTRELIILSDSDDDEVESPAFKIDTSFHEDITVDDHELQETKTGTTECMSLDIVENQCGEIGLTEKKRKEVEEEERKWWVEYGSSMIVDSNGFLLGEYRRLDEELYINIT